MALILTESQLKIVKEFYLKEDEPVNQSHLAVPANLTWDDLEMFSTITFARSGGAGGQNVNKVSSKAILKFDYPTFIDLAEDLLNELQYQTLKDKVDAAWMSGGSVPGAQIAKDGIWIIQSSEQRKQLQNKQRVQQKLVDTVNKLASPKKPRLASSKSKGKDEKRLRLKKQRGQLKKSRGKITNY